MTCLKCKAKKPRSKFGSYSYVDRGMPKTRADYFCAECRAETKAAAELNESARAQGYAHFSRTPEFKRSYRRKVAEVQGKNFVALDARYADGEAHRIKRVFMAELRRQWQGVFVEPEVDEEAVRLNENKRAREYYWRNVERARVRAAAYKHSNPSARAKWNAKRADRQSALSDGSVTPDAIKSMFAKSKSCPYCGHDYSEWRRSLDHLDPLSKGGSHSIVNLVVCCWKCNQAKRSLEFRAWVSRLDGPHAAKASRLYQKRYGSGAFEQSLLFSIS